MKYIIGSFILSSGVILILLFIVGSLKVEAPENIMLYLGVSWIVLAVILYPVSRKIVRNDSDSE